jgi:hypothetical protein
MKTDLVRAIGFIGVAGAIACSSATELAGDALAPNEPKFTCTAGTASMRLPAEFRTTLPTFGDRRPDDQYVAISNSVPGGFAGIYFEDDRFVMTFVDPATANNARAQIQQAFDKLDPIMGLDVSKADFRPARWSFAELDEWYRYITVSMNALPGVTDPWRGVTVTDIDEKANTLAFGVIDEEARARLESELASLNVSCNLVTTQIQAPAQAL